MQGNLSLLVIANAVKQSHAILPSAGAKSGECRSLFAVAIFL